MMKNMTSLKKTLPLLFLFVLGHVAASAASKLYVSDFTIAPNTEKELELNFDTDATDINLIEVDITLPAGLSFVDYGDNTFFLANDDRFPGAMTTLNRRTKHLMIAGTGVDIQGSKGAVATFKVKAAGSSSLAATSILELSNAKVRHADKSYEDVEAGSANVTRVDPSTAGHAMELSFAKSSIEMNAGETTEVEVNMTNPETMITGLTAKLNTSAGLAILGVKGTERMAKIDYNAETGIFVYQGSVVNGESGAVVKIVLQAASDYSGSATLTLSNISAATLTSTGIEQDNLTLDVTINSNAVAFAFSNSYVMMNPGDSKDIVVTMTSDITFRMMEARLVLPAGITAQLKKGDRLAAAPNYNANTGKIAYTAGIKNTEGSLFIITLTASDEFTTAGQVLLNGIVLSTSSSATYEPAAISLDAKPYDNAAKAEAEAIAKTLQDALNALGEDAVKYGFENDAQAIQEAIDNLKKEIEDTYNNGTISTETIKNKAEEIKNATEQLNAKIANCKAYDKLTSEVNTLKDKLTAAISGIAAEVADQFTDAIAAIEKLINDAQAALDAAKEAISLTDESTIENKTAIEEAISQLSTDAAAAKQAYDEELAAIAKKQANDEAYNRLTAELDALDVALNAAETTINEDAADVKDTYLEQLAELQTQVDAAREALEAANEAVALTEESTNGVLPTQEQINAIVAAAKEAQDNYILPGDIDKDGQVSMEDFFTWINVFMMEEDAIENVDLWDIKRENTPELYEQYKKYDVNNDGKFTVLDAQTIFNLALGIDMGDSFTRLMNNQPTITMFVQATTMSNDITRYTLHFEGSLDYSAFQVKVAMSEGMIVVGENVDATNMVMRTNSIDNNHYMIGYTDNSVTANHQLLSIDVKGKGTVNFEDLCLSTANAKAIVVNMGGTTSISSTQNAQPSVDKCYDLNGKLQKGMKKGLNIVRDMTGNVKKVVVK